MRNHSRSVLATLFGVLSLSVPASAQVAGFSDVPANHWAAGSVSKLVAAGVLQGPTGKKPATPAKPKYDGNKPVTRYELAVTLYRLVQAMEKADAQKKSKLGADITGPEAMKFLVDKGYLPNDSPLGKDGAKLATANQLAEAATLVVARIQEKRVPITPGSKYATQ